MLKKNIFYITMTIVWLSILGCSDKGGEPSKPAEPFTPVTPITPASSTDFIGFMADKDTDEQVELYKYPIATGLVSKLSDTLVAGGDVTSFAISPNRLFVAYVADQDTDDVFELYVVPVDLSTSPVKVSGALVTGGDVSDNPVWAPDSSRIAFRHDGITDEKFDVSSATPTASALTQLNIAGAGPGDVVDQSIAWSPDSSTIAYMSDQDSAAVELYTTSGTTSATLVKTNAALVANGNVTEYHWSPDGSRIAYRADQVADEKFDVYATTPAGASNFALANVTLTGFDSNVEAGSIVWAPNSSAVAYRADTIVNDQFDLFSASPLGAAALKLNSNLLTNRDIIGTPSWSPDSTLIAYLGDINTDNRYELFVSYTNQTSRSFQINGALLAGNVQTGPNQDIPAAWSADSTYIAYTAQQNTVGVEEVFVGRYNGVENILVSGSMVSGGSAKLGAENSVWAANNLYLNYRADQITDGTDELFNTDGNINPKVSATPAVPTGLKTFAKWSPDGSKLLYASEEDTPGTVELYMSSADSSGMLKVSGGFVAGGNVNTTTFVWAQ